MTSRRTLGALCAPLLLALAALLTGWSTSATPAPAPASAPSSTFSADRALTHIAETAAVPHPSGSGAQAKAQQYIADRLTDLGLTPGFLEETVATATPYSSHLAGRVRNIVATVPGSDSTGTVLLVAHTDSVAGGPGASDNGLGVASLVEVARALKAAPQQRNDVVLLFTDSEELGRLGATAYLAAGGGHPDPARTVVLNLDARGTSGRAVMFETGPHNGSVVPALGEHPAQATSLSREIYRMLPHETDFTSFREAGYRGLNFAVVGGSARYHTPEDSVEHVDSGSLQDMGTAVLGATRHLAATDIGGLDEGADATYFSVAGLLVHYPQGAVVPLAMLALAGAAGSLWWAVRSDRLRTKAVLGTAAALPLALALAAAGGWTLWQLALLIRPEYAAFVHGAPYEVALPTAGLVLFAGAAGWLWLTWSTRRATPAEVAGAVTLWLALLCAATAVALPGASYLFCWPALAGAAGLALCSALPEHSPWRPVTAAVCGLPAVLLIVPPALLLLATVGPASAAAPLAVLTLPVLVLLLAWGRPFRPRGGIATGLAAALLAAGLVGTGAAADTPDASRPTPVGLMYALDADRGEAYWLTDRPAGEPWLDHYTGADAAPDLEQRFPTLYPVDGLRTGKAVTAPVARPTLKVEDPGEGANRRIRLHLGSEAGPADLLGLYVDTSQTEVESVTVGATTLPGAVNRPFTSTPWKWGLVLNAPGRDGAEVTLTVRSKRPVRVLLTAQSGAVPDSALDLPRPDTLTWSPEFSGTVATRVFTL